MSADACGAILAFWRTQNADGTLAWPLTDPTWDTRFLGDLYQDLSDHAKKKYALLQTPDFVEGFILERTLTPALAEVELAELRLIDPTCGSGHFLLGAFERLLEAWLHQAPAMDTRERVQCVLTAINGVDINPFAVAIARFRLMLAAMRACGARRLAEAPAFKVRVAVADSLIAGDPQVGRQAELDFGSDDPEAALAAHRYAAEDVDEYPGILARRQYHVVVGNPPYITVKDKALNEAYRSRFRTCHRQYALSVPFMELFFDLAVRGTSTHGSGDGDGDGGQVAGWVGQITSNSFMKREFGSKLIEGMLSGVDSLNPVDLTEVIDTSGAYIPGHGTPTVILIGRRRRPTGDTVHAVLGVRGEPGAPADPRKGLVWSEIVEHIDDGGGFDGEYVTVTDLPRETLAHHPWSLSGGGAGEVLARLNGSGASNIGSAVSAIGRITHTGADEVYFAPRGNWNRQGLPTEFVVGLVQGDIVRDYHLDLQTEAVFPYDSSLKASLNPSVARYLFGFRSVLASRREPGGTHEEIGLTWYEWSRWHPERFSVPLGIAFAFVATHNHFVLDRGGKVFKQSAPVIKLPEDATEDDHLGLLGVLNSSVACFWLKQVSQAKSGSGMGRGIQPEDWMERYEFTGTKLQEFPLPASLPTAYGRILDSLAQTASTFLPAAVLNTEAPPPTATTDQAPESRVRSPADGSIPSTILPSRATLAEAHEQWRSTRCHMIAWQEELDWYCYRLYGLIDEDLTYVDVESDAAIGAQLPPLPPLNLAERAFEIVLARRIASGEDSSEWFARHGSTPITDLPADWPRDYSDLVERRLAAIASNPAIRLLERPEFKRRWAHESWESMQAAALREYILDRLESRNIWFGVQGPQVRSVAQIADAVRHDSAVQAGIDVLFGRDADRVRVLGALLADESVPFLAAHRYKPSGLVKRAEWEAVWELQRREDAGERGLDIPVPPKYAQADFRKATYWKARGKLDVPKERFIAYPGAQRETDATEVYGWAGWDHAEAASALAGLLIARADADGWDNERIIGLLAGMVELEPWLHQWHAEIDPEFGTSPAGDITALLDARLAAAGITRDDARAWHPPAPRRGRGRR